jgi:hypothetical protein
MSLIRIWIIIGCAFYSVNMIAQNVDSLNARIAELRTQVGQLNSEIAKTQGLIPPTYGWSKNYAVTLGFNNTSFNNWTLNPNSNSRSTTIMASMAGGANLIKEKYFWRNNGLLNLGWQRLQLDKSSPEGENFQPMADLFRITSLFGWNLTEKLALSTLGQLRTSIIQNAFNPGYIDIGAGVTWTPMRNLVAVIHPLNYNLIIAEEALMFESSLGAQYRIDYNTDITKGVKFRTNLTGFASYSDFNNLSNLEWISGISFTAFKGIGIGLEYALRWAPQETRMLDANSQSYFLIGLSYAL